MCVPRCACSHQLLMLAPLACLQFNMPSQNILIKNVVIAPHFNNLMNNGIRCRFTFHRSLFAHSTLGLQHRF